MICAQRGIYCAGRLSALGGVEVRHPFVQFCSLVMQSGGAFVDCACAGVLRSPFAFTSREFALFGRKRPFSDRGRKLAVAIARRAHDPRVHAIASCVECRRAFGVGTRGRRTG